MAEPLRHTDGSPLVLFHGKADSMEFVAPDGPWELHIMDDDGIRHVFNVHGITSALLPLVKPLEDYWNEGLAAARGHVPAPTPDDLDAYEPGDPKRVSLERERG